MPTPQVTFRAPREVRTFIVEAAKTFGMSKTEFLLWALRNPVRQEVARLLMSGAKPALEVAGEPTTAHRTD